MPRTLLESSKTRLVKKIRSQRRSAPGYSLMEMLVVVSILLVTTAIAVPLVQNAAASYQLKGATSSITTLIQATRYRAMQAGYEYQLIMTASGSTYQIQQDPTNTGSWTNVSPYGSGPLFGSSVAAVLGQNTTLAFHPSGVVVQVTGAAQVNGASQIKVTYRNLTPETISVTNYGYVSVSP